MGRIYNFDLEEKENAISTFRTHVDRFPEAERRPDVLYELYLIFKELENEEQAEKYASLLTSQHPNSVFAKLILNPNYYQDNNVEIEKLKKYYAEAYAYYTSEQYEEARPILRSAGRRISGK